MLQLRISALLTIRTGWLRKRRDEDLPAPRAATVTHARSLVRFGLAVALEPVD